MFLLIGFLMVVGSTLGGFMIAGGNPIALIHVSEIVTVGGITMGLILVAAPMNIMKKMAVDIRHSFQGGDIPAEEFMDLMKLLYELFMIGRRNGLIALDEHVTDPKNSTILSRYPSFLKDHERVEFLCNSLRPIIDGKIKPEQLEELLDNEIYAKEQEAHGPIQILNLAGDSMPGVGICAAVLGIINTMASVSDGPEVVGEKVAAALTGTFLGVYGAYGFINPLGIRIGIMHKKHFLYFTTLAQAVSGFAKGLAPLMAIEIARRSLMSDVQPTAEDLEATLKNLGRK
jgi:chemotaxis protein MotA